MFLPDYRYSGFGQRRGRFFDGSKDRSRTVHALMTSLESTRINRTLLNAALPLNTCQTCPLTKDGPQRHTSGSGRGSPRLVQLKSEFRVC